MLKHGIMQQYVSNFHRIRCILLQKRCSPVSSTSSNCILGRHYHQNATSDLRQIRDHHRLSNISSQVPGSATIRNFSLINADKAFAKAVASVDLDEENDKKNETVGTNTDPEADFDESKYQFLDELDDWYRTNFDVSTEDSFEMNSLPKELVSEDSPTETLWTSTFVCPVTGHRVETQYLHRVPFLQELNDMYYFPTERLARLAAARHAVIQFCPEALIRNDDRNAEEILSVSRLQKWYMKHHQRVLSSEEFLDRRTTIRGKRHGGDWWTCSFVCPITSEEFPAVEIKGIDRMMKKNGVVLYRRRQDATQGAALAALDEKDGEDFEVDSQTDSQNSNAKDFLPEKPKPANFVRNASSDFEDSFGDGATQNEHEDDTDEEEDYVIQFIPRRIGDGQSDEMVASTTLDLVSQAWIKTSQHEDSDVTADQRPSISAVEQRQNAIERATSWLAQQVQETPSKKGLRTQFDDVSFLSSSNIATKILESLASTHRRVPYVDDEYCGVQEAAEAVIEQLYASACTPDPSCYAAFIQCLEGDRFKVATRASKILEEMVVGVDTNGRTLPAPTIDVFNAVLQRQAEAGIKPSLSEFERWPVNRQSFLVALSSIAQAPPKRKGSNFDSLYILDCLDKMNQNASAKTDQDLHVGIDVLNAPMRWTGNTTIHSTGNHVRSIGWDDIHKSYARQVAHFDERDPLVHEASDLNDWLRSIEKSAFGPNNTPTIETYESVIQAWIRTGTLEGINRADSVLRRLCDENGMPRIRKHTVYPLIAALAYTQQGVRVDEWMAKLQAYDKDLVRDSQLQIAPIVARTMPNTERTAGGADALEKLKELVETAFETDGCKGHMKFEPRAFSLIIQNCGWKIGCDSDVECTNGIIETLELHDQVVVASKQNKLLSSSLMLDAPTLYYHALQNILQLNGRSLKASQLGWIEGLLRRCGEHVVLASATNVNTKTRSSEDFSFDFEELYLRKDSWGVVFDSILYGLRDSQTELSKSKSDVFRLLVLMSEIVDRSLTSMMDHEVNALRVNLKQAFIEYHLADHGPVHVYLPGGAVDELDDMVSSSDGDTPSVQNQSAENRAAYAKRRKKRGSRKSNPSHASRKLKQAN